MGATPLVPLLEMATTFGAAAVLLMGVNKRLSGTRLSLLEMRILLMAALLGGWWGIFLGGRLYGHKVSASPFWALVSLSATVWAVLVGMASIS
jgi:uncharacterized membrane protein YsdA (DUF1294 family)